MKHVLVTLFFILTTCNFANADDEGPAWTLDFTDNGIREPVSTFPKIKTGKILKISVSLLEIQAKDTSWLYDRSLFKKIRAKISLKNGKGEVVSSLWVKDNQLISVSKKVIATFGSVFSVVLEKIEYEFNDKKCLESAAQVEKSKHYDVTLCARPIETGKLLMKGRIRVVTDESQLKDIKPAITEQVAKPKKSKRSR